MKRYLRLTALTLFAVLALVIAGCSGGGSGSSSVPDDALEEFNGMLERSGYDPVDYTVTTSERVTNLAPLRDRFGGVVEEAHCIVVSPFVRDLNGSPTTHYVLFKREGYYNPIPYQDETDRQELGCS